MYEIKWLNDRSRDNLMFAVIYLFLQKKWTREPNRNASNWVDSNWTSVNDAHKTHTFICTDSTDGGNHVVNLICKLLNITHFNWFDLLKLHTPGEGGAVEASDWNKNTKASWDVSSNEFQFQLKFIDVLSDKNKWNDIRSEAMSLALTNVGRLNSKVCHHHNLYHNHHH